MHNSGRSMQASSRHRHSEEIAGLDQPADLAQPAGRNEPVTPEEDDNVHAVTPIEDEPTPGIQHLQITHGHTPYIPDTRAAHTAASPSREPQRTSLPLPPSQDVAGPSTYRDRRQAQDLSMPSPTDVAAGSPLWLHVRSDLESSGDYILSPALDKNFRSSTLDSRSPPADAAESGTPANNPDARHQTGHSSSRTVTPSTSPTAARSSRRSELVQRGSPYSSVRESLYAVNEQFYRSTVTPGSESQTRTSQSSPRLQRHGSSSSQQTQLAPVTPPPRQGTALLNFNPPLRLPTVSPSSSRQIRTSESSQRRETRPASTSHQTPRVPVTSPTQQELPALNFWPPPSLSRPRISSDRSPRAILASASVPQEAPRTSQSSLRLERHHSPTSQQTQRVSFTPPLQQGTAPLNFDPPLRSSGPSGSVARPPGAIVHPTPVPHILPARPSTSEPRPSISRPTFVPSQSLPGQPRHASPPRQASSTSLASKLRRKASETFHQTAQSARASIDDLRSNLRSSGTRGSSDATRTAEDLPSQASPSGFSPLQLRNVGGGMLLDPLLEEEAASRAVPAEDQVDTSESDQPSPVETRAASRVPFGDQAGPANAPTSTPPEPRYEEYMYSRRSRHRRFRNDWERRYFRLRGTTLEVYEDDQSTKIFKTYRIASAVTGLAPAATQPSRLIPSIISSRPSPLPVDAPYAFEFTSPDGKIRTFAVRSAPERQNWMREMLAAWRAVEARRRELDAIDLERARQEMKAIDLASARRRLEEQQRRARSKGKGRAPPTESIPGGFI